MDILNTEITSLPVSQLVNNEGQIPDVPKNPRNITEDEFKRLVESIKQDNLTGVEPLKVFAHGGSYVVLGGNQRLRALQKLGIKDVPCIVVPENTPADVLRKIVINDNSNYGEWNMDDLANEWGTDELQDWSVDVPSFEEEQQTETERLSEIKVTSMYYEPEKKPKLKLEDCIDYTKYNAKLAAIREMGLSKEQQDVLEVFARRFIRIDFESVANYYQFNASENEKLAIERLRLVLVDSQEGGVNGWIEDDILRVRQELIGDDE